MVPQSQTTILQRLNDVRHAFKQFRLLASQDREDEVAFRRFAVAHIQATIPPSELYGIWERLNTDEQRAQSRILASSFINQYGPALWNLPADKIRRDDHENHWIETYFLLLLPLPIEGDQLDGLFPELLEQERGRRVSEPRSLPSHNMGRRQWLQNWGVVPFDPVNAMAALSLDDGPWMPCLLDGENCEKMFHTEAEMHDHMNRDHFQ